MFPNIFCQPEPRISDIDLDRPAKDLPLEAIYQLGLKLHDRHATCGDWANLAELLGYGRDKIDEFENQSAAERRSASFLMLKDWTKQTTGRSLYVLRESLRRCRREDCVLYLDQKVMELSSMQLYVKLTDEFYADPSPRFMTVTTRCDATLRESLENLLGGNISNFEIDASWNDKASNFKGRHLSVRRTKRENVVVTCESDSSSGDVSVDKIPYNDLSGNRTAAIQSSSLCSVQQDSLTRKKVYLSEECLYCGKFRTITRIKPEPSGVSTGTMWQDTGVHQSSCQCEEINAGIVSKSRDVNMESDEELVSSSTDTEPHAMGYFNSLQRAYRGPGPGNNMQTLVKVPRDHQILAGNTSNQPHSYMVHNVYMTSTLVKQPVTHIPQSAPSSQMAMSANQNFGVGAQQANFVCLPNDAVPQADTTMGSQMVFNPRERSFSAPAPFTGLATVQSPFVFMGASSKVNEGQVQGHNVSNDSLRDTIADIFSGQHHPADDKNDGSKTAPPELPPRSHHKNSSFPLNTVVPARQLHTEPLYTFPGEREFQLFNSVLYDVAGWWPRETEMTVEDSMSFVSKEDGHYMIWYMRSKNTLVLSVSHLGKIIHYAVYTSIDENGQTWYYIFPSKRFTNVKDLIQHHIEHGLDPQSQQEVPESSDGGGFISQQNMRQSRRLARLFHVRLRYPVKESLANKPRQSV